MLSRNDEEKAQETDITGPLRDQVAKIAQVNIWSEMSSART